MLTEVGGALRSNKVFRGDLKLLAPHLGQVLQSAHSLANSLLSHFISKLNFKLRAIKAAFSVKTRNIKFTFFKATPHNYFRSIMQRVFRQIVRKRRRNT